ncbi:MAG: hypothetical protein HYX94_00755 [Chloroflexi bacterium]|nr:hypothetical protein [Chloroflexota bacterium]
MALLAISVPILPGKTAQWRRFAEELTGPRFSEYSESRRRLGVHERAFLQTSPHGDTVIVTVEGNDPKAAFEQFSSGTDDFTRWFVQQVKDIHGFDLSQGMPGLMPDLLVDSEGIARKRTV